MHIIVLMRYTLTSNRRVLRHGPFDILGRAARCTENIGASRFALYGSGFDSGIPDFGSVRFVLYIALSKQQWWRWKIILPLRLAIVNDFISYL